MKKSGKKYFLKSMIALGILAAVNAPAYAMEEEIVSYGGYDIFRVQYFDLADREKLEENKIDQWNLDYSYNAAMKKSIRDAFEQWAEILYRNGKNMKQPGLFVVGADDEARNASAGPTAMVVDSNGIKTYISADNFLDVFQNGLECGDLDLFNNECDINSILAFGHVSIGKNIGANLANNGAYYGWIYEPLTQQQQSESAVSLQVVLYHEIAHALGIICGKKDEDENEAGNTNKKYVFSDLPEGSNNFDSHLVDQNGNYAAEGQEISSSDGAGVFFVENLDADKLSATSTAGRVYFVGENVSEVLGGTGEKVKKFQNVDGIPILGWENGRPDFSHINLARGLMSHHNYRSYTALMEAELAIMQDIGYDIDRRNFFGRSIYSDGNGTDGNPFKNTQGYFARNAAGTAYELGKENTATLGVGLHVYGSNNNILQTTDAAKGAGSADLLACGTGGAGIRIDGVCNTVAVDKGVTVSADGENGRGVLVAYGHDNRVVIDGTVTAAGAGGDGVRFDFGSNSMGGNEEYRGSYLRYQRDVDENGNITSSSNIPLNFVIERDSISEDDLAGPMGSLIVNGKLYGRDHAVYISKNAFVNNINVNGGARIKGDIVSDWKHFDNGLYDGGWGENKDQGDKLFLQYSEEIHDYDKYHKDLVTALNFKGNTEMQGNIIGSDNMKMTVNSGTLRHGGSADVVNVKVNQGATLLGKSYTVNDMSGRMAEGISDDTTGKFINHGTIGALNEDSKLSIDGTLESDGRLLAYSGGSAGYIEVSNAKLLAGSTADVVNARPGDDVAVLKAGSITGMDNVASVEAGTLRLDTYGANSSEIRARVYGADSISGASSQNNADLQAINRNQHHFASGPEKEELQAFYNIRDNNQAVAALNEIGTNNKEQGTAAVSTAQSSTLNNRVLSSRLATAFGQAPATLSIGGASLAAGDDMRVEIPVLLPQEKDETAWIKFTKNWGNTAGDSNYTGSAITVGYDWKHGEQQRNGWFASYNDTSYGHMDGSENVQDTRIGYYTGLNKGADTQLFYGDFGYLDGERSRLVSINSLGTHNMVRGNYNGWIAEIGGEWKYALHAPGTKTWQVSPYGAMQLSYMKNNGYQEQGSIKAYGVEGGHNTYAAAEAGMEFTRFLPKGRVNFRLGIRQALMGADYQEQDNSRLLEKSYSKSSRMDRTHFVTSLAAETEFQPGWQLSTELGFQKGAHDKDIMASIQFRRLW
ncbi:MAG: autotransporter outer membrane beta-barrel domain-containing protein [Anaerovibrio sp.]|uniref:autotransporter outer membrane beta-barrel domain-containing protein n=1 Tax=Anaerovibrio sp. TaxID=1872532 RepID=UPI0026180552|nr:autotransporter outer membrane beta-barrel domain-containing protein [Anaerovibrio sp.]MDD7678797.1 autotransporter outer membrane beta-barrel domain-containing protein [Anaerovibrio sp.]